MKQFYILFAFIFLTFLGFGQLIDFDITATDNATGKKLGSVTAEVYDGTTLVKTVVSTSNGSIKFNLPIGKVYIVFFSKAGKVTRQVKVNSKNIDAELLQGNKNALAYFSVTMYDQVGNIDYSYIEKNPFTEFYCDGTNSKLIYDEVLKEKMDKKIKEILKQQETETSKIDALYNEKIAKAQDWEKKKNWQFALDQYTEAHQLKKGEQIPIDKIAELDAIIKKEKANQAANNQKDEEYKKIVATADALRDQGKYSDALAKYNEALKIKEEPYVKGEITKMTALAANEKKAAENAANYKKAIDNGETLFSQKKYTEAKAAFNQALIYKANDPTALKRIADIDAKIKEEGDLVNKKKNYEAKMAEAEQLLALNKLAEARVKFVEAKAIDNTQTLPDVKIKEIDAKLGDEAKNKAKLEQYNVAMKAADDLFKVNKLAEARAKYQEAAKIDNTQTKPAENIAKIDKLIADQEQAKKDKEKAAKIVTLMKEATALYAKNDLDNAKKKYQDVLNLDEKNAEATSKINEINIKIAATQGEAEKTKRFNDLKTKGIELMKQQKWAEAKQAFTEAKTIKADADIDAKLKEIETKIAAENAKLNADQQYNKILEEAKSLEASNIDQAIAKYKEAQKLKPTDPIPTAKIKELEAKKANNSAQAEIDKNYASAMKKGDELFALKKYTEAIKFYNDAGALKPNEKEPVDKAEKARAASLADVSEADKVYNKVLDAGQKAIDEKNWVKAKEYYNRALTIKKDDPLPQKKLKEIDALIKAEEDAKKGNLDKETAFKTKMTQAENAVQSKKYDEAIKLFEEAKSLKATDPLPQKRIDEVKILRDKEVAGNQTEKLYQGYMTSGNNAQNSKNYTQALSEYKNALSVKKNDKTALAKINEVQQLIDNQTNANTDSDFNKFRAEGDAFFDQKSWQKAKEAYEKALSIKNDKVTEKKYKEVVKKLQEVDEYQKQYKKVIVKADEYLAAKNYDKAKELYQRAITLNTSVNLTDQYPVEKLKEIDALLNPTVITPAGPLPALGTLTTQTPEERFAELKRNQDKSNQIKENEIVTKNTNIQNNNTETTAEKTNEIHETNANFTEIVKNNEKNYEAGDENRLNTTTEVEKNVKTIEQNTIETSSTKYNENLNSKETIKNVTSEIAVEYTQKDLGYTTNTENVKVHDQSVVNQSTKDNSKYNNTTAENQQKLNNTVVKIDENVISDYDQQKEIEVQVKDVNSKISKNETSSISKESDNILNLDTKLQKEAVIRDQKETEDAKTAGNNGEELDKIEKNVETAESIQVDKNITKTITSDGILANTNKVISDIPNTQDEVRKENVKNVTSTGVKTEDNTRNEYNKNVVKYLNSKDQISDAEISSSELTATKIADSKKIHTQIDDADKNTNLAYIQKELSDDEQRASTKTGVNNTVISSSQETATKAAKVDDNISNVQTVGTDIDKQEGIKNQEKKINLENSQVQLNKIASKEFKFDDKLANSLGATYPEGVSQEVFDQKDENDLLVAVVTRRIVVKNGYGQIYVRTQSLNGITYSKNGEPSSEHVWLRETQDAKLKKNY